MTKTSSALMSLIAAVPGALLALLLVMAFLSHADKMGGMLNAVVGVGLLAGVAAALMPVGILVFGGPKGPAKPKPPKKSKKSKDEPAEEEDVAIDDEAPSEELDEFAEEESSSELEEFEAETEPLSDEWDTGEEGSSDEFEFDDALSDDELDFDFDDEEVK